MLVQSATGFQVIGERELEGGAISPLDGDSPDIVLFDIDDAPDEALRLLLQVQLFAGDASVLILTSRAGHAVAGPLVLAGARGIVLKDMTADHLVNAIRRVHEGELWVDRATTARLITDTAKGLSAGAADPQRAKIDSLTRREREVIALIASGLSNKAAARQLGISDNTVRHHLTSIFAKLETHDRLELVLYALRHALTRPIAT